MENEIEEHISILANEGVAGGRIFSKKVLFAVNRYIDLKNESNALGNFLDEYRILCEKHGCYVFSHEDIHVRFLDFNEKFNLYRSEKGD